MTMTTLRPSLGATVVSQVVVAVMPQMTGALMSHHFTMATVPLHQVGTDQSSHVGLLWFCWGGGGGGFIHKFFVSLFPYFDFFSLQHDVVPYFDFFSLQHDVLLKTDEGLKELLEGHQVNI